VTTRAVRRAGAKRAMTAPALGGSSLPPTKTGPIALIAALARATPKIATQSVVTMSVP
jgi:hypothetical protein